MVDVTLGDLGPNDVRVQIKASGLCHSDLSVQTGALPFPLPMILGHEGAGVVTRWAPTSPRLPLATTWCSSALIHCGMCDHCVKGRPNLCLWGLQTISAGATPTAGCGPRRRGPRAVPVGSSIGTLAEELICHEKHAVPIPNDVSFEVGVPHRVRRAHRVVGGDEPGQVHRRGVRWR